MKLKRLLDASLPKKPIEVFVLWILISFGIFIPAIFLLILSSILSIQLEDLDALFSKFTFAYYFGIMAWLWWPRKFPLWWFGVVALITALNSIPYGFMSFLFLLAYFDHKKHFAKQSFKCQQVEAIPADELIKNIYGQLLSRHALNQYYLPEWYQTLVKQKLYFKIVSKYFFNGPPHFVLADLNNIRLVKIVLTHYDSLDNDYLKLDPHHQWEEENRRYYVNGSYNFYALDLISESSDYDPSGLLIFIPAIRRFATYDNVHNDVYIYPKLTPQNFFKHLGAYVSGQWNYTNKRFPLNKDDELIHLYEIHPWKYFKYEEFPSQ